ncbi:MAG: LysR substrate-binding domain-containing protein, partial [Alphaproteobacteria bacterium]
PDVRVELHSRSAHVIHELIPAQRFDIAIADLPANQRGVQTEPLTFECVSVLPAGHPLAEKDVITPRDLDGVPFISLFNEHIIYYRVASAFAAANVHWNVVAETRFFASNCAFVAYGTGVSIVDPITAADYASRGLVAKRFLPRIPYEIGLLYPTERPRARLLDALVLVLKRHLAPYVAEDIAEA